MENIFIAIAQKKADVLFSNLYCVEDHSEFIEGTHDVEVTVLMRDAKKTDYYVTFVFTDEGEIIAKYMDHRELEFPVMI